MTPDAAELDEFETHLIQSGLHNKPVKWAKTDPLCQEYISDVFEVPEVIRY